MNKYEIIIFWSADDNAFVAEIPELKGCMAHGDLTGRGIAACKNSCRRLVKVSSRKRMANT